MDPKIFQEQFGLLGDSASTRQIIDKINQIAPTDITVLLHGESGVGKDVTARAIHAVSKRKRNNLVIVNCGAIPEGIIESELFGHEKGAFTGANEAREGYFEKANGGTIFLDEIGDTPKNVQVKLLRILETGEFFRVGSSSLRKTDVRVIGATNKDLWKLVQKDEFREDLYYRLDTVKITIPPLRERKEDIIPIFRKFVSEFSAKYDSVFQGFADDARHLLISYRWPGNIRELRNVAEQLVVLEKSNFITLDVLKKYLKGRQHEGLADNLPMLLSSHDTDSSRSAGMDRELIYRALIEMKADMSDMKRMLAGLVYSNLSGGNIKGMLPDKGSIREESILETMPTTIYPGSLGMREAPIHTFEDSDDFQDSSRDDFVDMLNDDHIPSIEQAEKYLIVRALKKYEGNRRKASDALGVSERTLYRKIDQYDIKE